MRTKLLRKLRKRFVMYIRNGEYKLIDRVKIEPDGSRIGTKWMSKEKAIEKRRKWILREAIEYKCRKNVFA